LFVEETEQYNIRFKTLSGDEIEVSSPGFRSSFASLSWRQLQQRKKSALELKIDVASKTAYFRIEDSHFFKDSLDNYFRRINENKIQSLIIDLRGEGGIREEEQVAELYSYLANKPFQVYERIEVKSNDFKVFDKDFTFRPYAKSLKEIKEDYLDKLVDSGRGYFLWQDEPYLGILQPAAIPFTGTVYILVDGRTYSASTDLVSLASKLDNVFIVGEETGGEHRSYISGAMFGLVLPNSKIGVKIPTWKTVLAIEEDTSQRGRGVVPDFKVTQSLTDFLEGRDTVKEFAYTLIQN
jgi:C-terminal processing protease CtpA/Prc